MWGYVSKSMYELIHVPKRDAEGTRHCIELWQELGSIVVLYLGHLANLVQAAAAPLHVAHALGSIASHWNKLHFTVDLQVEKRGRKKINPQRLRRLIEREIAANARPFYLTILISLLSLWICNGTQAHCVYLVGKGAG